MVTLFPELAAGAAAAELMQRASGAARRQGTVAPAAARRRMAAPAAPTTARIVKLEIDPYRNHEGLSMHFIGASNFLRSTEQTKESHTILYPLYSLKFGFNLDSPVKSVISSFVLAKPCSGHNG